jgi:hypothetical protein
VEIFIVILSICVVRRNMLIKKCVPCAVLLKLCKDGCAAMLSHMNKYLHQVDWISNILTQVLRVSAVRNIYSLFIDHNSVENELQNWIVGGNNPHGLRLVPSHEGLILANSTNSYVNVGNTLRSRHPPYWWNRFVQCKPIEYKNTGTAIFLIISFHFLQFCRLII